MTARFTSFMGGLLLGLSAAVHGISLTYSAFAFGLGVLVMALGFTMREPIRELLDATLVEAALAAHKLGDTDGLAAIEAEWRRRGRK